jgi:hypothetical protein
LVIGFGFLYGKINIFPLLSNDAELHNSGFIKTKVLRIKGGKKPKTTCFAHQVFLRGQQKDCLVAINHFANSKTSKLFLALKLLAKSLVFLQKAEQIGICNIG